MLITTPRLVLRRFRDSDAETLAAYRSEPELNTYHQHTSIVPKVVTERR
jgi:RimJ/RimL family protein N-acetyltransferase